jgi:membrane protein
MIFLYIFMPNTKVRFSSALLGGVLAGTAWEAAQWGYFHFQVGMANYNAIYGTLSALPIFLVWVYTSWFIVLFGLEVVYAHQHGVNRTVPIGAATQSATTRDLLALSILLQVCRHFHSGAVAPESLQLSDELGIPVNETEELLENLRNLHFLAKVSGDGSGWLPAREPSTITLDDVLTSLRGGVPPAEEFAAACGPAIDLLCRESELRRDSLQGVTIHDLLVNP